MGKAAAAAAAAAVRCCAISLPTAATAAFGNAVLGSLGFSKQRCRQQLLLLPAMKFHNIAQQLLLWATVSEPVL
jgi:hypothetical protein